MFLRLVRKELLNHLLDFRFLAVFVLCTGLSALSVYVGVRNYEQQLRQYSAVSEDNRNRIQERLEREGGRNLWDLIRQGTAWNRRPEALSPVVYGMSGKLGTEVLIQYPRPAYFEDSLFSADPVHALFGVLDVSFIIKIILSLCVLLLTYDAVCGEKESGTLRLACSFPVTRSTLALAKLAGATLAALVPLVFSFLLVALVLAFSSSLHLQATDWGRLAAILGVFTLYLVVFAAFGICGSALTRRRLTAFLGLLGLWTVWLFIVPNLALRVARSVTPVTSLYEHDKTTNAHRWELNRKTRAEINTYWEQNGVPNWDSLAVAQKEALLAGEQEIREKAENEFYNRMAALHAERRNQMQSQQNLLTTLAAVSPLGAASLAGMDLARTGLVQQERLENAVNKYATYMAHYIQQKRAEWWETRTMADFAWFTYEDRDTLSAALSRNAFHILNLVLLAILGFAGAYVAILRYDVR